MKMMRKGAVGGTLLVIALVVGFSQGISLRNGHEAGAKGAEQGLIGQQIMMPENGLVQIAANVPSGSDATSAPTSSTTKSSQSSSPFFGAFTGFTSDDGVQTYQELPRWAQVTFGVIGCLIGLELMIVGYRYFRLSLFIVTGFTSSVIVFGILWEAIDETTTHKRAYAYGFSIAAGVLVGLIFAMLPKFGVFAVGASLGILTAFLLDPIALRFIWPQEPLINLYIWAAVFALLFGLATVYFERPLMILATCTCGSFVLVLSISGIVGDVDQVSDIEGNIRNGIDKEVAYYYIGFLVAIAVSLVAQCCFTSHEINHKEETGEYPYDYNRL